MRFNPMRFVWMIYLIYVLSHQLLSDVLSINQNVLVMVKDLIYSGIKNKLVVPMM